MIVVQANEITRSQERSILILIIAMMVSVTPFVKVEDPKDGKEMYWWSDDDDCLKSTWYVPSIYIKCRIGTYVSRKRVMYRMYDFWKIFWFDHLRSGHFIASDVLCFPAGVLFGWWRGRGLDSKSIL